MGPLSVAETFKLLGDLIKAPMFQVALIMALLAIGMWHWPRDGENIASTAINPGMSQTPPPGANPVASPMFPPRVNPVASPPPRAAAQSAPKPIAAWSAEFCGGSQFKSFLGLFGDNRFDVDIRFWPGSQPTEVLNITGGTLVFATVNPYARDYVIEADESMTDWFQLALRHGRQFFVFGPLPYAAADHQGIPYVVEVAALRGGRFYRTGVLVMACALIRGALQHPTG
jgi:hypothetical protein